MSRDGIAVRGLERLLRGLLPRRTAQLLLRDLDEGYQRRVGSESPAGDADRWYRRQLLQALMPWRLLELRKFEPRTAGEYAGRETDPLPGRVARLLGYGLMDLRYSLRLLVKSPGMTLLTIVVLAGGLGVSIFTYSLLNSMMLKPVSLPDGERIVRLMSLEEDGRRQLLDAVDYLAIRDSVESLVQVGAWDTEHRLMRGGETPKSIFVTIADPVLFDVAATPAMLGRTLLAEDARPGAEPVGVLSYSLWQRDFGGDPEVLDRLITLNSIRTRIVGIMPEGFGFPVWGLIWQARPSDDLQYAERRTRWPNAFAKLAPGVSAEQADAELDGIMQRFRLAQPIERVDGAPDAVSARVVSFPVAQMGDEAGFAFVTLNLVASSILLLACINVGNLLMSRASERARETTIRVALGAPRLRLALQMMGESVLVTLTGGVLALFIAGEALHAFDGWMRTLAPDGMPFWYQWGLDRDTVVAAGAFVLGTILLVGGIPAWRATRADSDAVLRDGSRGSVGSAAGRVTHALVIAQVAVIAVLMFIGGVSAYMTQKAASIDFGTETEGMMVSQLSLPDERYPGDDERLAFYVRLHQAMEQHAAIESAMLRRGLANGLDNGELVVEGARYESMLQQPRTAIRAELGSQALGAPRLLAGRRLEDPDDPAGPRNALVSESLARELWPQESAIGKQVRLGNFAEQSEWWTVVGVVSDVLEGSNPFSRHVHGRTLYLPFARMVGASAQLNFRHAGDPRAAILALHETVESIDRDLLPGRVSDFDEVFALMDRMTRLTTDVVVAAFGFALLLAVTGIYGLTARSVVLRTQEIGVRRAMGATESGIVRLFFRQGGRQLVFGLGIALLIGGATGYAFSRLLAVNPLIWVVSGLTVPAVITAIVLTAIYLPTRRAVNMEPSVALWHE